LSRKLYGEYDPLAIKHEDVRRR